MCSQQRQAASGKSARQAFEVQLPTRRTADFCKKHDHHGQEDDGYVVSALKKKGEEKCSERRGCEQRSMRKFEEEQSACQQAPQQGAKYPFCSSVKCFAKPRLLRGDRIVFESCVRPTVIVQTPSGISTFDPLPELPKRLSRSLRRDFLARQHFVAQRRETMGLQQEVAKHPTESGLGGTRTLNQRLKRPLLP